MDFVHMYICNVVTVEPTKSDNDVILCLQLLNCKTLTCTHHLS